MSILTGTATGLLVRDTHLPVYVLQCSGTQYVVAPGERQQKARKDRKCLLRHFIQAANISHALQNSLLQATFTNTVPWAACRAGLPRCLPASHWPIQAYDLPLSGVDMQGAM